MFVPGFRENDWRIVENCRSQLSFLEDKTCFRGISRTPARSKMTLLGRSYCRDFGWIVEFLPQVWMRSIDTEGEGYAQVICILIIWKKVTVFLSFISAIFWKIIVLLLPTS